MPKSWEPRDAKRFAREVKLNKPYYFVYKVARNLAPYEDSRLYSEIVFTSRSIVTGSALCDGQSAQGLCERYGPIYDTPPKGMRNVATPGPQVGSPLGDHHEAYLDEAELRGLDKQVRDGSDPRKRRPLGSWRV